MIPGGSSFLGAGPDLSYALFSRTGFDPNLIAGAGAGQVLLYSVSGLFSVGIGLNWSSSLFCRTTLVGFLVNGASVCYNYLGRPR